MTVKLKKSRFGLNEAEESRNKDLDFKEKNKWNLL